MEEAPINHHVHVAMFPPPGFLGHLIPFIELSKNLAANHRCHVTIIIPHDGTSMKRHRALVGELPPNIKHIFLPHIPQTTDDPSNADEEIDTEVLLSTYTVQSIPFLRRALLDLTTKEDAGGSSRLVALVMDLFNPYAIAVARELKIQAYIFYPIAATVLSLCMDLPTLDKSFAGEFRDLPAPLQLPGSIPLPAEDLPSCMQVRAGEAYKWSLTMAEMYHSADGILVNTFQELEHHALESMASKRNSMPPVYAVGPLVRAGTAEEKTRGAECIKWLDNQPPRSVLYVSFGSDGTLTKEQNNELALGLEMSGQRFIWVVRRPQENAEKAYLNKEQQLDDDNPLSFLPLGFVERVKDRSFIVPNWAPQIQVLGHASTGGIMTHCGWNSVLESVVFGVPLLVRPLAFEQKMNAVFLTNGPKIAARLRENEKGVVGRGEVSEKVRELMVAGGGGESRARVGELKEAAARALGEDGSSSQALADVFSRWISGAK